MDRSGKFFRELLQQDFQDLGGIIRLSGFREAFPSLHAQCMVWQALRKLVNNELKPNLPLRYLVLKYIKKWENWLCLGQDEGTCSSLLFFFFVFLSDSVWFCVIVLLFSCSMMNVTETDKPLIFIF